MNRNGVTWMVRVRRSGSFSMERRVADPAGADRITARATNPSGEVCRAGLTI
jgi:hypothetical protein